ncbi:hypothetical protein U1Q18_031477 [Sarracenia purpurea var. burkii]
MARSPPRGIMGLPNCSKALSTSASPYSLVYGSKRIVLVELAVPSVRMALVVGWDPQHRLADLEAIEEKKKREKGIEKLGEKTQQARARAYNKKVQRRAFNEGDMV